MILCTELSSGRFCTLFLFCQISVQCSFRDLCCDKGRSLTVVASLFGFYDEINETKGGFIIKIKTFDERLKLDNGDYDRLVHSRKPKGIDDKKAYIVGTGIAGLSTAGFLIKDAKMDPSKIVFLEKDSIAGGALDGKLLSDLGYVARGGRETGHHFEVLWDLLSVIPSREDPDMSILDDLYYTNLDDPNFSNCRVTKNRGERYDNGKFNLSRDVVKEILRLVMTPDEKLEGVSVEEVFSDEFLESDFWTFYRTMFAFENWHSVLELKLYINRFIHHVAGLPDLSALQFTRYDQY